MMNIHKYISIMLLISITMAAAANGMNGTNNYIRSVRGRSSRSRRLSNRENSGFLSFDEL